MFNLIVTGGAGLIGSNLVRVLNQRGERNILVVDHLNHPSKQRNLASLHIAGFCDKTDFLSQVQRGDIVPPVALFHLGACSSTTESNVDYLFENNTRYTEILCRWALARDVRFVYASSAATYGDGHHGYTDVDSITVQLEPLNPYGQSKQDFDILALREGWLQKIVGIKYFNVFGFGEDHKGGMCSVIRKAFDEIHATRKLNLFRSHRPNYRDGEQRRDFMYVDDAVNVTLHFLDHFHTAGLYNCGTGNARTWVDLGKAIFSAMGLPADIHFIDIPPVLRDQYQYHTEADLTKLRSAGWVTGFTPLETAVADYVAKLAYACGVVLPPPRPD